MKVYEAKIYQSVITPSEPYRFLAENWDDANKKLVAFVKIVKKDSTRPEYVKVVNLEELFTLDEMVIH